MKIDREPRLRQPLFWSKALLSSMIGSLTFGFIYAFFAKIDEVVVARGELQAIGAERPVKSPISGEIDEILINEGDLVNESQILFEFDTKLLEERLKSIDIKLINISEIHKMENQLLIKMNVLKSQGAISQKEYLQQKNKVNKLYVDLSQYQLEKKDINLKLKDSIISSPLRGKIFNLIPSSRGYYTSAGEVLVKIIPTGDLEAKVFISNSDVGFIRESMNAEVRIDAYPFTQFGSIDGELRALGNETIIPSEQYSSPHFPAYIKLKNQKITDNGKKINLRSGQSVSVNFIVKDRPIISILTDSIEKAFDSLRSLRSKNLN